MQSLGRLLFYPYLVLAGLGSAYSVGRTVWRVRGQNGAKVPSAPFYQGSQMAANG